MSLDFPTSPINGQTYTSAGKTWVYDATTTSWQLRTGTDYLPLSGGTVTDALGIVSGTVGAPGLFISGDVNTGIYSPGADQIALATGGVGQMFVDASGNVGIGTSSPGAKLHAAGTLIATGDATLGGNSLSISGVAGSYSFINSTSGYLQITSAGNTLIDAGASGNLIFRNSTTERLRIDSSGRLLVGVSANTNGGVLQLASGITFPTTQVTSSDPNTLDDYEEGTFTPTVIGSSTAGTASYTVQNGRYTKVGRLVHFELYVFWGSGTGTGNLCVAGLPFTCNGVSVFPAVTVAGQNNVASSTNTYLNAYIQSNTTTIYIMENPVGGGARSAVSYDAGGELILCGSYSV
jgi:hypothetical protein